MKSIKIFHFCALSLRHLWISLFENNIECFLKCLSIYLKWAVSAHLNQLEYYILQSLFKPNANQSRCDNKYVQSVSNVMNYLLSPPFHPSFFVYTFPYLLGDNRVFSCVSGQIVLYKIFFLEENTKICGSYPN